MLRILAWRLLLSNNGIVNALFGLFGFGPVKMLNTPTAVVFGMVYDLSLIHIYRWHTQEYLRFHIPALKIPFRVAAVLSYSPWQIYALRSGKMPLVSVSYTHLDVYKRQLIQSQAVMLIS